MPLLFADAPPVDWIAGAGGWSAAAMLAAVLSWIFFRHLPAKDAQGAAKDEQILGLIATHDRHTKEVTEIHGVAVSGMVKTWTEGNREQRSDFRENLKLIIDHCQRENATRDGVVMKAIDEVTNAVVDLRQAVEELRSQKKL